MAAAIFLAEPEQQNWSIIRSRPRVGLVSGYSPGLKPLLDLYNFRSYDGDLKPGEPYENDQVSIFSTGCVPAVCTNPMICPDRSTVRMEYTMRFNGM